MSSNNNNDEGKSAEPTDTGRLLDDIVEPTSSTYKFPQTTLTVLESSSNEYKEVQSKFDDGKFDRESDLPIYFSDLKIVKVEKIFNLELEDRFKSALRKIKMDNKGYCDIRYLFHGTQAVQAILERGLDERYANINCTSGAGIYFSQKAGVSNDYVFGCNGCNMHQNRNCCACERKMFLFRVVLGIPKLVERSRAVKICHPQQGTNSTIIGSDESHPEELVVYKAEQTVPRYLITYTCTPKRDDNDQESSQKKPKLDDEN